MKIINGDATQPMSKNIMIIHCCNDIGAWGSGFVIPLAQKYPKTRSMYKEWHFRGILEDDAHRDVFFELGETQFVKVDKDNSIWVANMIGQHGCGIDDKGNPPIRYDAIRQCLKSVSKVCKEYNLSIQMPKFGAGLAGGDWNIIQSIIEEELNDIRKILFIF